MAKPPEQHDADGLPSEDELRQLDRWALTAYAARCAMRVQPLVGADSFGKLDQKTIRKHIEAVDIAITIFAVSGDPAIAARAATSARAAYTAAFTADGARGAFAAYAAANTADTSDAPDSDTHIKAADAAGAADAAYTIAPEVATSDALAAIEASREDYEFLMRSGDFAKKQSELFSARKLWLRGNNDGEVSPKWNKRLDRWEKGLHGLGLADIATRHHRLIDGEGFDMDDAKRRVDLWWATQREEATSKKRAGDKEKPAVKKKRATKKPAASDVDSDSSSSSRKGNGPDPSVPPLDDTRPASGKGDMPAIVDRLGRERLVHALGQIITTPHQDTPLTLALLGKWGTGKSSVVRLLKRQVIASSKYIHGGEYVLGKGNVKRDEFKYEVMYAEYNAWEYEDVDNTRAALAQEIVNGLTRDLNGWRTYMLRFMFGWVEHRKDLIIALAGLATALLVITGTILAEVWNVFIANVLGLHLASFPLLIVGSTFAAYIWKQYKPLLDHPTAVQMQKYLNLPDYRKDLGMIPTIRRHLKTLCRLRGVFQERNDRGIVSKEGKRRLLVVVDDLDRCHDQHITETLDAIKLVMDIPGVIVLIAIDHRIAFRAMAEHYKELAGEGRSKESIARDYLGKIIQLPVMLPEPENMNSFIDEHLFAGVDEDEKTENVLAGTESTGTKGGKENKTPEIDALEAASQFPGGPHAPGHDVPLRTGTIDDPPPDINARQATPPKQMRGQPVVLKTTQGNQKDTVEAREQFRSLTELFSYKNPRQLLRLRNTYRLIVRLNTDASRNHLLMSLLFWHELLAQSTPEKRKKLEEQFKNRLARKKKATKKNADGHFADNIFDAIRKAIGGTLEKPAYEDHSTFVTRFVLPHGEPAPKEMLDSGGDSRAIAQAGKAGDQPGAKAAAS